MKKFVQYRHCSDVYGQYYPFLILHSQEQNPKRVAEAVHESSARINEIVPGHPDSLPEGGRITPIIYVWGGQAELRVFRGVSVDDVMGTPVSSPSEGGATPKCFPSEKKCPFGTGYRYV